MIALYESIVRLNCIDSIVVLCDRVYSRNQVKPLASFWGVLSQFLTWWLFIGGWLFRVQKDKLSCSQPQWLSNCPMKVFTESVHWKCSMGILYAPWKSRSMTTLYMNRYKWIWMSISGLTEFIWTSSNILPHKEIYQSQLGIKRSY